MKEPDDFFGVYPFCLFDLLAFPKWLHFGRRLIIFACFIKLFFVVLGCVYVFFEGILWFFVLRALICVAVFLHRNLLGFVVKDGMFEH